MTSRQDCAPPADPLVGKRFGHIRILELLAAGGMGSVYVGVDEKLERRVAVKTIQPDRALGLGARARFLREARVLSQLKHPNICQIHDFIEAGPVDLLVLELVEGTSLEEALQGTLEGALKMGIAAQLLGVLAAAHEQAIVHRDLKPANIMLTAEGSVKVLDFGLSRFVGRDTDLARTAAPAEPGGARPSTSMSTAPLVRSHREAPRGEAAPEDDPAELEATLDLAPTTGVADRGPAAETKVGEVVGTLGYMSPEQARGEPVGPAADIYCLGLVLQELFTGKRPYHPGLGVTERLRKTADGESPPVTGIDSDLAALIGRMKSPAPGARPSAADAAERLRWIQEKPRRRLRRLAAAVAVTLLGLLGGVMTFQAYRISQEAERANREAERATSEAEAAREVTSFLVNLFEISDPGESRGNSITARELLDEGAGRIERELEGQPLTQARLMEAMGLAYGALGLYDESQPLLEKALEVRSGLLAEEHPDLADSLHHLGTLHHYRGDYSQAEPLYRRALGIRERSLGPEHPDVGMSLNHLAALHRGRGEYARAKQLYRRALSILEGARGPDHPDVGIVLNNLAAIYRLEGDYDRAEPLYRRDLEISEKALGPDHPDVATSLNNLAVLYRDTGDHDRAEPLFRRSLDISVKVLGPGHPDVGIGLVNLAMVHRARGASQRAEPLLRRALEVLTEAVGPDRRVVAETTASLAGVCTELGRHEEAERLYARAHESMARLVSRHPDGPRNRAVLAEILVGQGNLEERMGRSAQAERRWMEALALIQPLTAGSQSVRFLNTHGRALLHLGRREEAEPIVEKLLARRWRDPEFLALCRAHGFGPE